MTTAHDSPDSAELAPPQDDLATRKTLGSYELKKKLGQGGMGAVYLALDTNLKRQVALKILPREKAANPQLVKRFKAEAQNASLLTHDNIVSVYGAGETDGYLFIALEFIDGIDVHDLVQRRGVLPVKRSIDIIKQVARALQHALDQGIVHRDIKPANLLIRRDGMVKLADMGLARAVDETMETSITRAGTTVGTVDYMSPEQARNSKAADVRSDIYSLGCTWYHMLTGAPPFAEGSLVNKLNAHAKQPPPDPRDKNSAVPEGVVAVMQRMLAKNPDDRYQTPGELIKDLEGALVNRDAVSQKILEAIDDDSVHGDEDDYSEESSPPAGDQSPDSYPVEMPWSDSVEAVQTTHPGPSASPPPAGRRESYSVEPESSDDEPVDPGPRRPTGKSKPPPANQSRGSTTSSPGTRHSVPTPLPESTPTSHKSSTSSSKPAATPSRPTPPSGKGAAAGTSRPHTLPPPKRKNSDTGGENPDAAKSGPVKLILTALAVVAGLGILVFLAHLAQQAGEATAPAPVAPTFGGALPPPPPPAAPAAAEGAATADVQNPTVKDVLIERNDQLDGNAPVGPGGKSGPGTQNVAAVGSEGPKLVPDWVDSGMASNQLPMFSVRKGPSVVTERRYATLQEAFKNVDPTGARIVLFDDGPYDLLPTEIPSSLLVIEAAEGAQPQIRLVADGEHRKLPWLDMMNGSLALDGVNFIGAEGAVPVADPWSWIRVTNGHLFVRRSSFTLMGGKRSAPTTVLRLAGVVTDSMSKEISAPRFLLDQSVIRGENLRCVQFESPAFDGVVRQSLLVAGDAPTITIRSADKAVPKGVRRLKFVNATVCSREQALFLSSQGTANPIETELNLHETLFSSPPAATQATLLHLEDWPAMKPRAADAPPFKNLRWIAAGSAILGFRPLLKISNDDAATVADGAGWKKLFKDETPTTISSLNWPAEVPGGNASAPLKTWSLKSLDALTLSFPVPNVTPGCPVTNLRAPDFSSTAKSVAHQPQRPRPPIPFAAKSNQQVDLNKTDLGKFLASKDWEDGTVFVASGSGQKFSSPLNVDRHRWRIQFRQTDGPTLVISPRAGPRSGGDNGAFVTIRGGQLDIEHGTFSYDLKDQQSLTPWFLYAEGGGFSLLNCRIQMPSVPANRNRGLIRWAAPAAPEKPAADGEFANYGQITDSLLIGNGVLLSADLVQRAVLLNNSAFVSRQHLFEFTLGFASGQAPAVLDSQNCTYLAGGTQLSIKSQSPAGSKPLPSRFGHRDCVFAALPADPNARTAPLLMNYAGAVPVTDQILWHEESCGYSSELKAFFATEGTLPVAPLGNQEFDQAWTQRWGAERVQRPLQGANGVLFEKTLPGIFVQVRAENLQFHKTAKARTWSESGGPIGVRPAALEPPPAPPRATTPNGKKPSNKVVPKVTF